MSALTVGDRVWVPNEEYSWLAGRISSMSGDSLEADTEEVGKVKVSGADMKKLESCGERKEIYIRIS